MNKEFFYKLADAPKKSFAGGSVATKITKNELASLNGLSLAHLKMVQGSCQEPHWHPGSHHTGYVLKGKALFSLYGVGGNKDCFTLEQGDMFFIPKGYIHTFQNIGNGDFEALLAFDHAAPVEEMRLGAVLCATSSKAFCEMFKTPPEFVEGLKRSANPIGMTTPERGQAQEYPSTSRFKFSLDKSRYALNNQAGYLKLGVRPHFPVLENIGLFAFGVTNGGDVEPHWHPNAGELVYVTKGRVLMTVVTPQGNAYSEELGPGEGGFAPASFYHSIASVNSEPADMLAFFSHHAPNYVGIGAATSLFSNEVLSSLFQVAPDYFKSFQRAPGDLVLLGGVAHEEVHAYAESHK